MEHEPKVAPYGTADPTSFAHSSAKERWPVILTGAIDDIHKATSKETGEKHKEGAQITSGLATIKYELQHNRKLIPLPDDGQPDIARYNEELEKRGNPHWHDVSWLYAECYLYRRVATLFANSQHWKNHDVFSKQKTSTFRSSRSAVLELAARYNELTQQLQSDKSALGSASSEERAEAEKLLFIEMCEICLWGNATDLSLLTNLSYDDIQKLQGKAARKANEDKILVNDFSSAFAILKRAQETNPQQSRRVDIVLDNAGFELFVDLILAGYLLQSNLATSIVLHPKNIPWFVSDVIPKDFADLLTVLVNAQNFYETPSDDDQARGVTPQPLSEKESQDLHALFENWSSLYAEGKIVLRPNVFWTEGGSYWRLPATAPKLYDDLQDSELVIFKGDLNYRKLTGDVMWDPTTPFSEAIGPLGPGSGVRTLALRTCKADVVVGLEKGVDEKLRAMEGGGGDTGARKWAWSGKWAVVSFCDGKEGRGGRECG